MKYNIEPNEIRIYKSSESCIFKKNNDEFGSLSNMATKFPIIINGIKIKTSEALYQICRFPFDPEIQSEIIDAKSPMTVKMISRANIKKSRKDWENVKAKIMKWCISVKLAQNFIEFGEQLSKTGFKYIVENSAKDNYWGAIPNEDETVFTGKNGLGRLLMQLRLEYYSEKRYDLLYVEPLDIPDFKLLNQPIQIVDERVNFINYLRNHWKIPGVQSYWENDIEGHASKTEISIVAETLNKDEKSNKHKDSKSKKKTRTPKISKNVNNISLFNS